MTQNNKSLSKLLIISTELVASGIVGLIIGIWIDKLFGTKPIFLLICLLLSFIAGFRSIYIKLIR